MAVNCWVVPWATFGFVGVTDMEVRAEEVTVKVVFPEIV
jgi:hypothetical protein